MGYIFIHPNETKIYEVGQTGRFYELYPESSNPLLTINSPTATTYTSNSVLINVSITDDSIINRCYVTVDSGVTNTSLFLVGGVYTTNLTSLSNGNYVAQFYCSDVANNINNTENVSFTVTVPSGDSNDSASTSFGGGGSGGTVFSSTTTTTITDDQTFETIVEGEQAVMTIDNEDMDLTEIAITTSETVSDASVSVLVTSAPQSGSSGLPLGSAYQTFAIEVAGFEDKNLEEVSFDFKVNKTWMASQGGVSNQISLFRQKEGETGWNILNTVLESEDANYYYFTAISPGFSTFSIFLSDIDCIIGDRRCVENFVQTCLENQGWKVSEECGGNCQEGMCLERSINFGKVILYGLSAIIILSFLAVLYFILRRFLKKRKVAERETPEKKETTEKKENTEDAAQSLTAEYTEKYLKDK